VSEELFFLSKLLQEEDNIAGVCSLKYQRSHCMVLRKKKPEKGGEKMLQI
jgi:hypothetical protein